MEGIKPPRPLTHDLMKNIIGAFGAELTDIVIDDLREGTFFAKLNIDSQQIDSRPSDAIALAVRYGAQIYVSTNVMDEPAFVPEEEEEGQQQAKGSTATPPREQSSSKAKAPETKETKLENLRKGLKEAIEKENYEKAALIRDEIRKLESRD